MPYPTPGEYITRNDVAALAKDVVDNSGVRLTPSYFNLFSSSCAAYRRNERNIIAEDNNLERLLYTNEDYVDAMYDEVEQIFAIKNNCDTLSEPNNWIGKLGIYGTHQRVRGVGGGMLSVPQNIRDYLLYVVGMSGEDPRGSS